jgi:hypothetical protein
MENCHPELSVLCGAKDLYSPGIRDSSLRLEQQEINFDPFWKTSFHMRYRDNILDNQAGTRTQNGG